MLMWALKNWQGALAAFLLSYALHCVSMAYLEDAHEKALSDQKSALTEQCDKDKAITKGAQDALQRNYDSIAARLARFKRMQLASCVPVSSSPNDSGSGNGHAGAHGISTGFLLDFAAECETYRSTVIVLDKFIADERK